MSETCLLKTNQVLGIFSQLIATGVDSLHSSEPLRQRDDKSVRSKLLEVLGAGIGKLSMNSAF